MTSNIRIVLAQLNFLVGDIEGNAEKIIKNALYAQIELKADLIVFPELALTGYPPEDLLLRPELYDRCSKALYTICREVKGIDIILGVPLQKQQNRFNAAIWIHKGEVIAVYHKRCLPNYSVFDEVRYFQPGKETCIVNFKEIPIALTICEDAWHEEPIADCAKKGAKLLISINASPFDIYKHLLREQTIRNKAQMHHLPILYVNCIGGQDELVFDGGSMVFNSEGEQCQHAPFYEEALLPIDLTYNQKTKNVTIIKTPAMPLLSDEERIYRALVLGVRDYVEKNSFPGALIGLSGGIDSSLTLAIAVDALGPDKVQAILMPSRYTSPMSIEDATQQAQKAGVYYTSISIEPIFTAFLDSLKDEFADLPSDTTEENLQARCRGTLLMALSNKKGSIVLSTGNKSELAVGYATLYGDMVGGFSVLKDVYKTWVYRLAEYRNSISNIIPKRIIERPPSAELAPDQKDEDYLPPYQLLDAILELYIEKDQSVQEIISAGYDKDVVRRVAMMVDRNEYKRRQAPTGVRITKRAFGRDRRYPITSGFSRYLR